MTRLVAARDEQAFHDVQDLASRACLDTGDLQRLAAADALRGLAGHRHRAFWTVSGVEEPSAVFPAPAFQEAEPLLRSPTEGEDIVADYHSLGLTLGRHPLALLRRRLRRAGIRSARAVQQLDNGSEVTAAGLVICRQRPGSASGVIFVTLEDETGHLNAVVWPAVADAQRQPLLQAQLLAITGKVQHEDGVLHLIARRLDDYSAWLGQLPDCSRNFR